MFEITVYKKMDQEQPLTFKGATKVKVLEDLEQWIITNKPTKVDGRRPDCFGLTIKTGQVNGDLQGIVLLFDPRHQGWYVETLVWTGGDLEVEEGPYCFRRAKDSFLKHVEKITWPKQAYIQE
jgi:hypothetical protein